MPDKIFINVQSPDGSFSKREVALTPNQDLRIDSQGQVVVGRDAQSFGELDVDLADIATNTVAVTGPAWAVTTDDQVVFLPAGSTAPADNGNFAEVGGGGSGIVPNYTVATNTAKLALTGLADGDVVLITDEANRLERFADVVDSPIAFTVDGFIVPSNYWSNTTANAEANWTVTADLNGRPTLTYNDGSDDMYISYDGVEWVIYCDSWGEDLYTASGTFLTPWAVTLWEPVYGGSDMGQVFSYSAAAQETNEDNWQCITHTAEILYDSWAPYGTETFNGETLLTTGGDISLGWFNIGRGIPCNLGNNPYAHFILKVDGNTLSSVYYGKELVYSYSGEVIFIPTQYTRKSLTLDLSE